MRGIRQQDLRGGLRVLRDIGAAGPDLSGFARAGVQALPSLVASEVTTLPVCDLGSGRRTVFGTAGSALSAQDRACFDRFFREHPLVRYHAELHGPGAHRISDSLSFSRFRQTPLYNEYYRRIGIDHVIALPIHVDARTLVSFVLNRRGRDFSDRERDTLDLLREHLAQLYRRSQALERAQAALSGLNLLFDQSGSAWMRLGPQRELLAASAPALSCAARYAGAVPRPGQRLPAALDRWLAQAMSRGAALGVRNELMLARGGDRLRVRAMALPALEPAREGETIVMFQEQPTVAASVQFASLPLTPRERDVMQWLAAGKTDRDIAGVMGCSHRTVQKHLERIYTKLGVETRTAAVMRVLAATLE
jgi:DNA-binding CsgD family transcriptional regulator